MSDKRGDELPEGANVELFDVPFFYASGMQAAPVSNDVILTFNRIRPGIATAPTGERTNIARVEPVANVTLSLMTFKEMVVATQELLEKLEKEHGEITSAFLRAKK